MLYDFTTLSSVCSRIFEPDDTFTLFLADRTDGRAFGTLCRLSVCRLSSVIFFIVAKWYVLANNCLKKRIGNQGQKLIFWVAAIFKLPVSSLRPPRRPFFCLSFARTAQRSVLDGTNGLSNSKPCVYCRIVRSELKPEVVLATIIDPERCKWPQNAYDWAGIALLTSPTG